MGTDYDLLGSKEVLDELQNGRTRELLLLLQNRRVPEVQDPMNIQSGLSLEYDTDGDGDFILSGEVVGSIADRGADDETFETTKAGIIVNPNRPLSGLKATVSSNTPDISNVAIVRDSDGTVLTEKTGTTYSSGDTVEFSQELQADTRYRVIENSGDLIVFGRNNTASLPATSSDVDIVDAVFEFSSASNSPYTFKTVTAVYKPNQGYVTDKFAAPTTPPADFKAWNAIRAEGVTTGGSTSANPVEFEILDSTDTALNSSRIPASEIADSGFKLRGREWQTTASAGQTAFTIPTTGSGGHYGIPILSVVTVEQNGSVLDGTWEFDGAYTVTLSSGASDGDTITVSYDLDVFDSTLQPRAYLSREDGSETSPSISHFRYEYMI